MTTAVVLDASAILALVQGEAGADVVAGAMEEEVLVSAVNLAEAATKLVRDGFEPDEVRGSLRPFMA